MREIKFRAWDAKRNVMFDVQTGFLPKGVTAKRNFFIGFNSTGLEVSEFEGKGYWRRFPVMQYTGLKDKNGVEIYEGDIIHYKTHNGFGWADYDQISEVYWNFGGFGIRGSRGLQGWISQMSAVNHGKQYQDAIEVIGNIYEHPDLLREQVAE